MMTIYRTTRIGMVLAVILALPALAAGELAVHTENGASYVSGGVGDDERKALEAMSPQFDLRLTMVLASGHFISDVTVRIQDASGRTVVDTVADGPLLLAQLQPGTYAVTCTLNGHALKQTAHVTSGTQRRLIFRWDSE